MLEVKADLCIGKLKEKLLARGRARNTRSASPRSAGFQIVELNEARLPQDPNAAEIAKALERGEPKAILRGGGAQRACTRCALRAGLLSSDAARIGRSTSAAVGGASSLSVRNRLVARAGRQP
jgi:hypothetical protein